MRGDSKRSQLCTKSLVHQRPAPAAFSVADVARCVASSVQHLASGIQHPASATACWILMNNGPRAQTVPVPATSMCPSHGPKAVMSFVRRPLPPCPPPPCCCRRRVRMRVLSWPSSFGRSASHDNGPPRERGGGDVGAVESSTEQALATGRPIRCGQRWFALFPPPRDPRWRSPSRAVALACLSRCSSTS